jgi:predicted RNA-binding Zn-ribbon protein involved in translation (DUF1610 family)
VLTGLHIGLWALIALPFVVMLLVLVAVGVGRFSLRQTMKFAENIPCPECGKIVGRAAVLAAKDRFLQKLQETRKQNPGVLLRIVAEWEIECPNCGCRFSFYPDTKKIGTSVVGK